jgi:nucleotide-binding universal stress UspA family protein
VQTIVVGVDGSRGSRRALEFALYEARYRRATLRVVRAWSRWSAFVNGTAEPLPWPSGLGQAFDEIRENADPQLERWVESARDRTGVHDVEAELETHEGDAARVLLGAASDADLLIVGMRGRHDPGRAFLASIGRDLRRRAACPVVFVPDHDDHQEAAR